MMDIIILSLKRGDIIHLKVSGVDEKIAFKTVAEFVTKKYLF